MQQSGHTGQNIQIRKNNRNTSCQATEVCGKLLREKYTYKSMKTSLLLSNVIDVDHQISCLFTNKGRFSLPLWILIGVLAKIHE